VARSFASPAKFVNRGKGIAIRRRGCLNGFCLMKILGATMLVERGCGRRAGIYVVVCGLAVAVSGAAEKGSVGDDPFVAPGVHSIQIEVKGDQLQLLEQYEFSRESPSQNRPDARATVRDGLHTYTNVAIHLKGAMGSFRPLDDKPALTLNFDKFASGQRYHG
jgi:hypothetical protein